MGTICEACVYILYIYIPFAPDKTCFKLRACLLLDGGSDDDDDDDDYDDDHDDDDDEE